MSGTLGPRSVLIVDDNSVMRMALVFVIEGEPALELAGEATNAQAAIELSRQIRPDVIVLDQEMPRCTGLDVLPELRTLCPHARIAVWSSNPDVRDLVEEAGGDAFIDKQAIDRLRAWLCET